MIDHPITRRTAAGGIASIAAAATLRFGAVRAADKSVTVGLNLSLTGAEAQSAKRVEVRCDDGLRRDQRQRRRQRLQDRADTPYDDGTATSGQYDPAQAATNARKMVSDKGTVAAIGPLNEWFRQGHGADPQPGRPRHHHAELDQSGHHRPEVRRAVSAGGQGDLLPHRRDRRVPGTIHGELLRRRAACEDGLCP